MTLTITLPDDIERPLLARAATLGRDPAETLLLVLRDTIVRPAGESLTRPLPRLRPGAYPDDEPAVEEAEYRAVPFPVVGTAPARFIPGGRLTPSVLPDLG